MTTATEPHVDRMKLLREHFAAVPEDRIDMSSYWCGTAGCLAGHACNVPEFNRLGLHMTFGNGAIPQGRPVYMGRTCDMALGAVLGISANEASDLCDPNSEGYWANEEESDDDIATKSEVIDRLDALIAKYDTRKDA